MRAVPRAPAPSAKGERAPGFAPLVQGQLEVPPAEVEAQRRSAQAEASAMKVTTMAKLYPKTLLIASPLYN